VIYRSEFEEIQETRSTERMPTVGKPYLIISFFRE